MNGNGNRLEPGGALSGALFEGFLRHLSGSRELVPGEHVGPYRIEREVGRGGSGVVYLAQRADGAFTQTVALKWLRSDSPPVGGQAGLQRERELLASLDHPHIARILDGGRTRDGMLWFAMDFVDGEPIHSHSAVRSIPDRLRLFQGVCRAVHYAHRRGLIHGDIKPSNVLVDSQGRPRLLDFGIAQLQGADSHENLALTPAWASPEQLRGDPLTTASDIYQLGRLLEAILVPDARRPPPSRDLAAIVKQATVQDPERRYASAAALEQDLAAWLHTRPVTARQGRALYRFTRMVQRNWALSSLAASALLVMIAGTGWFTWQLAEQRDVARAEAARAEQASRFLMELFQVSDPAEHRGDRLSASELLQRGAERLDVQLAGQPAMQASLAQLIGELYMKLGHYDQAEPMLRRAVGLRRRIHGEEHVEVATALNSLGNLLTLRADYAEAESLYRGAAEMVKRTSGPEHPELANSLQLLAEHLRVTRNYAEAEALSRRALELRRHALGPDHPDVASSLYTLAASIHAQARFEEAEHHYREALEVRRRILGHDHPGLVEVLNNVGILAFDQGHYAQAEDYFRQGLELARKLHHSDHPDLLSLKDSLAVTLSALARHAEAEPLLRDVLERQRRTLGADHPRNATVARALATTLTLLGKTEEPERLYREALAIYIDHFGEMHHEVAKTTCDLARLLRQDARLEAAEAQYRRCLGILEELVGADHPHVARASAGLAEVKLDLGQAAKAEALYRRSLAIMERLFEPDHPAVTRTEGGLERALARQEADIAAPADSVEPR